MYSILQSFDPKNISLYCGLGVCSGLEKLRDGPFQQCEVYQREGLIRAEASSS